MNSGIVGHVAGHCWVFVPDGHCNKLFSARRRETRRFQNNLPKKENFSKTLFLLPKLENMFRAMCAFATFAHDAGIYSIILLP
jgi:hypothetical protein